MDRKPTTGSDVYPGRCPECGGLKGLHALSCLRHAQAGEPAARLTDAELSVLRALAPSQWEGWPPDEYDQGLPVVEIRQDHLRALLEEVEDHRRGFHEP